jgi:hypothetical protein
MKAEMSQKDKQIQEIKWELAILMEHERLLRMEGRDHDYDDDKRKQTLRLRLDHLLGFHEPTVEDDIP